MTEVSCRRMLTTFGLAGAADLPEVLVSAVSASGAGAQPVTYLFLNAAEAASIEAAVSRLIPADDKWGDAIGAGVPSYIDKQLAGAWGAGERLYRSGPWQPGAASQGYQLPFTHSELAAPRVFAPARITVLKLLASQAAIALENARLYRDVAEREGKIRHLVEANIIGILIWKMDGQIIDANDAFLHIVGYDREDLVSGRLNWIELTPPEWRARDRQTIVELKTAGTVQPYEKEYIHKDGSRIPVLIGVTAFDEKRDHCVAFVLDLTERKRAEEALRDSEEQWKAAFESNPTMYSMVDASGTILSVNTFGAELLGYSAAELIGQPVQSLFHEADGAVAQRNVARCLQQIGRSISWEMRKIHKDGQVIWVRETARAMLLKQRPVLLLACENITEVKRATEALHEAQMQLRHANRVATMGQLAASVAHEVSQPIATAGNNAEAALRFLDRDRPDLNDVREALDCIVSDTDRARLIIDRIRDHIRKAPLRRESFDLNEAIDEVIALARSEVVRAGASVQTCLSQDLSPVKADRVQVQQVLMNLILNANDAMSSVVESPRELLISTEHTQSDGVLVTVCDSGPGIDPEHLDRVFEAFYTTKSSGIGMGLAICRSIIDAHGGRLWAQANKPRGAIFQFTLPGHEKNS
jgi:PAS domain S-box-containing protein